ncbi:MAG: hypothetical protein K2K70_08080 [Lachnospiraceae bacterium]|nr:hypothetical protein [Lachnospiraceae bacterium]
MADRRYSSRNRSAYRSYSATERHTYVDGNTVRRIDTLPRRSEEERRREEERQEQQIRRRVLQQPVRMPWVDMKSILFLAAVAAVTLYVCFNYIQAQNQMQEQKNRVVQMEYSIASQRESNNDTYQEILDSVDLSEVYNRATGKLGMVQAQDNQIHKYQSKKSDTVKQYGKIPNAH